jgi:hypothetical protein
MIKKILLVIVLVFLITGIGFAFQNEPDGFRGLKWGDPPTEDMTFLGETREYVIDNYPKTTITNTKTNCYYKRNEKNNIGSAELYNIFYNFNLYSNQFYKVMCVFYSEDNYNILGIIFREEFGEPTYTDKRKNKCFLKWVGDKTEVQLYYDPKENKGWIEFKSMEIHPEKIEDNKQKELEKAKEDF